jgi:hypothetical protein
MATAPQAIKTSANPWLVLVFLSLGYFMIRLDTTIVNIAIPASSPPCGTLSRSTAAKS